MPEPVLPIAATIGVFSGLVTVTFSVALLAGPLNAANWTGFTNRTGPNLRWVPSAAPIAAGNQVTFPTVPGPPFGVGNAVSYLPPPFDVVSDFGFTPAAAFVDFPLAVV